MMPVYITKYTVNHIQSELIVADKFVCTLQIPVFMVTVSSGFKGGSQYDSWNRYRYTCRCAA